MLRLLLSALAATAILSSCGKDDGGTAPAPAQPMAAPPADFPSAEGKNLSQLTKGLPKGAILTVSSFSTQTRGPGNRLGFAIVDRSNKQLDVSALAVYTAKPDGSELEGPFDGILVVGHARSPMGAGRSVGAAAGTGTSGAVMLGKLNMHEFAHGTTSVISHYGPVRNPWNREHIAGGSSGGAADRPTQSEPGAAQQCAALAANDHRAEHHLAGQDDVRGPFRRCIFAVIGRATHIDLDVIDRGAGPIGQPQVQRAKFHVDFNDHHGTREAGPGQVEFDRSHPAHQR